MLFDERGVYGGLPPGHELDRRAGLSDDELFKQYQREDPLWNQSEQGVHNELGLTGFTGPTDTERLLKKLAKKPSDLSYSSYHRHSQLEGLLRHKQNEHRWEPLEGIDRYWVERKAEKQATGDFETTRRRDTAPKEGQVRIVIPHFEKGQESLGVWMEGPDGLTVVKIINPQVYEAGLRVGDEIREVNKMPVTDGNQFKQALTECFQRNRYVPAPVIIDVWRQPARSVHHGASAWAPPMQAVPPMPAGPMGVIVVPVGNPAAPFGAPGYPAPPTGSAERFAALARENALLRGQLRDVELHGMR